MHVKKQGKKNDGKFWLLPICSKCNSNQSLNCGGDACPKYATTKTTARFVQVEPNVNVAQARKLDPKMQAAKKNTYHAGKRVKTIKDRVELKQRMRGLKGACRIMFTMKDCPYCVTQFTRFIRYAGGSSSKVCYRVDEKLLTAQMEKEYLGNNPGYPYFYDVTSPGKRKRLGHSIS